MNRDLFDHIAHIATWVPGGSCRLRQVITIGRVRHQLVTAGLCGHEAGLPTAKAVASVVLAQGRVLPGCTSITGEGDALDPSVAAKGDAAHFD